MGLQGQVKELSDKVDQDADKSLTEINELRDYVIHTNGLLSSTKISLKDTRFIWTIHNFREKFHARNHIESSKFYCRPEGHLCQLYGFFEQNVMKLAFRLAKGKNSAGGDTFVMNVSCQLLYNDGSAVSESIKSASYRKQSFTFNQDSDVTPGIGFSNIPFKKDDMDKYLIDNTCTVVCT